MKTIGENIASIRQSLGLSQFQLAELLGTHQQNLSKWESGKLVPKTYYIAKLIIVLDTTFEELTDGVFPDLEQLKKSKK